MILGILEIRVLLPTHSLKEKRSIINSLKEKLRHSFNVAVAEIDELDNYKFSTLAIVTVSNNGNKVEEILSKIENYIFENHSLDVVEIKKEVL